MLPKTDRASHCTASQISSTEFASNINAHASPRCVRANVSSMDRAVTAIGSRARVARQSDARFRLAVTPNRADRLLHQTGFYGIGRAAQVLSPASQPRQSKPSSGMV